MLSYLLRVLIAFDVFMAVVFNFEDGDITISAACGKALQHKTGLVEQAIGLGLNKISAGHTDQAIIDDIARCEAAIKRLQS
jgi:hypothetical protein